MRILIITSCFAPKNVIGAVRVSKIAKYLIREGHDLTIISPVLEDYDTRDMTLECNEFKNARRLTVPYSPLTTRLTSTYKNSNNRYPISEVKSQVNTSIKSSAYKFLRNGFVWWRDYEWGKKVNSIIKKEEQSYDLVISSYPNLAPHYSALYAKRIGKARRWIADFRDPIVIDNIKGEIHNKQVIRQSEIVKHADWTVSVTKKRADNFVCYTNDKQKIIWVPNGFDQEDLIYLDSIPEKKSNNHILVFSYAGGMYRGERDCSPLFKALKELIIDHKIEEKSIRFDYAGADYSIILEQASKYGLDMIMNNKGMIPRAESLKMQYLSDCVVVANFCYKDYEGAIPGKLYEPVMMSKPIIMLLSGSGHYSEAASFVREIKAGCAYEASVNKDNVSEIKEYIQKIIIKKEQGTSLSNLDSKALAQYKYENITKKIIELAK